MDWYLPALQAIGNRETALIVLNLVLILVIDRRLTELVKSSATLVKTVEGFATHNTSRMDEIRNAMTRIARWMGREDRENKPNA